MELSLFTTLALILGAFICELIDSSLGMLYGTILSPSLIIAGFDPLLVVPSILFSQAIGGSIASIFHQHFENVKFKLKIRHPNIIIEKAKKIGWAETIRRGISPDLRAFIFIGLLGILGTTIGAFSALTISKKALNSYIGILVFILGLIIISGISFRYSWKKMLALGVIGSFNKGLSGGGFGPLATSGQVISGRDGKGSIGATTLSEAPICIVAFLIYWLKNGISDWSLVILLTLGALSAAPLGAFLTSKFRSEKRLKAILGILCVVLGIWTLIKTWIV